jgi:hypothetical protein
MNSNFSKSIYFLCISLFLVLSSCGGGKSSTASTENDLPSPVAGGINGEVLLPGEKGDAPLSPAELALLPKVSVGQRQFADPNVLLQLRGSAVAAEGANIVKTIWTQVSGPQVRISSPLSLDNMVLLPDVIVATQMEFRLTAEDSKGKINSATMSILVKPVPTFVKVIGGVFEEKDAKATFTVRLNAPSDSPVTISYVTRNGTAIADTDYVNTAGSVLLDIGQVSKEIAIPLIDDAVDEVDENFSLQVTTINGENIHTNSGIAIIHNGKETLLPQTIQFADVKPLSVVMIGDRYSNPVDPKASGSGTGSIIYQSSNPLVATIDNTGTINALALGTTKITATKSADSIYASAEASYDLQVIPKSLMSQNLQFLNKGPINILISAAYQNPFDTAVPSPGTGAITYSSSNSSVASVDTKGNVLAASLGTATITASKAADAIYAGVIASYDVRVVASLVGPVLTIDKTDGYSIDLGDTLRLTGTATDAEDGPLPTQAQLAESAATGLPITSIKWDAGVDGFLGYGNSVSVSTLSQGRHFIFYSVTDSDNNLSRAQRLVFVGNIAPFATVAASSTLCIPSTAGQTCFLPSNINDTNLSGALADSWANDDIGLPQWVSLTWPAPATINTVELYTTAGPLAIDSFDIEYIDANSNWIVAASVTSNIGGFIQRVLPVPIVTTQLRIKVVLGSAAARTIGRVNEVIVFGTRQIP